MSGSVSVPRSRAGAILTIDLDAIVQNWRDMQSRAPGAEASAVVKADAYGLGAIPVSQALHRAGCKTFCVAHIEEGITLRAALPDVRIFVLNGTFPGTEADLAAHALIPSLSSWPQVEGWVAFNRTSGAQAPCALQVDTGMTRLGLNQHQAETIANDAELMQALNPCLIMSHFACADEPSHPLNQLQISSFAKFRQLFPTLPGSLAQSAGTFLGGEALNDMTRPGIALYGGNPLPPATNPMRQVAKLSARIVQIQSVDTPQTVGYGASYAVPKPGRLATVSLGYADGFLRAIGNCLPEHRICATVADRYRAPLVGRISMDLSTFDISDVPEDTLQVGDTLDVIGKFATIDDLATAGQTIPYEVLTALGPRFHRIYLNGSAL